MGDSTKPDDGADRLVGWKAIAGRLKVSQRTAIRWADAYGLPVSRVPRGDRPVVFAAAHDLDAWWGSAAAREARGESSPQRNDLAPPPSSLAVELNGRVPDSAARDIGVGSRPRFTNRVRKALLAGCVVTCVAVAGAAVLLYWPQISSAQIAHTLPWKSANGAHGRPASGRLIELSAALAGSPRFAVTVTEGEMARLETAKTRVGIQSRLADGYLKVLVYRLEMAGSGESAAYVASRTLSSQAGVAPVDIGGESLDLMWQVDFSASTEEERLRREPCCMVCSGVTACGRAVSASCGRCQGNGMVMR